MGGLVAAGDLHPGHHATKAALALVVGGHDGQLDGEAQVFVRALAQPSNTLVASDCAPGNVPARVQAQPDGRALMEDAQIHLAEFGRMRSSRAVSGAGGLLDRPCECGHAT
jgi:hypothetical protein